MAIQAPDHVEKGETFSFLHLDGLSGDPFLYYDIISLIPGITYGARISINNATSAFPPTSLLTYTTSYVWRYGAFSTAALVAGGTYLLVLKRYNDSEAPHEGDSGQTESFAFRITQAYATKLDTVESRLAWLRNDIENVLFPRTKRLCGYWGEASVMDLFTFDDANNMETFRVRLFDTAAHAAAATPDVGDENLPEPGEILTVYVEQSYNSPRSTRKTYKAWADPEATDATATENTAGTPVNAPGNGTWPATT